MPTREPSNREILNAIKGLSGDFKSLSKQVAENTINIKELKTDLKDVQETVEFLKENVVLRDEFHEGLNTFRKEVWGDFRAVRSEMRIEFQSVRHEIIEHVDGFIGLYKKQELEHLALVSRVQRHEELPHNF